jgi:hypothetical protein
VEGKQKLQQIFSQAPVAIAVFRRAPYFRIFILR